MNSTKKVTVSQAAQLLAEKNSFALFAHTNPDGDTLGACIALCIALRKLDKNVRLFCDMPISDKLKAAFPEMCEIVPKYSGKYDMLVAVDCGDLKRVGESLPIYTADFPRRLRWITTAETTFPSTILLLDTQAPAR